MSVVYDCSPLVTITHTDSRSIPYTNDISYIIVTILLTENGSSLLLKWENAAYATQVMIQKILGPSQEILLMKHAIPAMKM